MKIDSFQSGLNVLNFHYSLKKNDLGINGSDLSADFVGFSSVYQSI